MVMTIVLNWLQVPTVLHDYLIYVLQRYQKGQIKKATLHATFTATKDMED